MKTLADLVEQVEASGPDAGSGPSFQYIDASSIDPRLKQVTAPRMFTVADAPSRARQRVRPGDVLVSTVRPKINSVAQVGPQLQGAIASTGLCVLRPASGDLFSRYLYHWVRTPEFIAGMVRHTSGKDRAVTDRSIRESTIPLPPVAEQRRIANILDWADKLRVKRLRALELLDELAASMFAGMFEQGREWPQAALADLVTEPLRAGATRSVTGRYSALVLTAAAITRGRFDATAVKEVEFDRPLDATRFVREDDLVICRRGRDRSMIGRAELAPALTAVALADTMSAARLDQDVVDLTYARAAFNRPAVRWQLEPQITTSGSAKVGQDALERVLLPVPPRQAQRVFASRMAVLNGVLGPQRRTAALLDDLFASLQSRAFSGEL